MVAPYDSITKKSCRQDRHRRCTIRRRSTSGSGRVTMIFERNPPQCGHISRAANTIRNGARRVSASSLFGLSRRFIATS